MKQKPEPCCILNDGHGIFIPQIFAERFLAPNGDWTIGGDPVTEDLETSEILAFGPDHPDYWGAWIEVEQNATFTDLDGTVWHLLQDGDLFGIPEGMEWDDDTQWFVWPTENEETR